MAVVHCHLGVLIWLRCLIWAEVGVLKLTMRQVGYENPHKYKLEIMWPFFIFLQELMGGQSLLKITLCELSFAYLRLETAW